MRAVFGDLAQGLSLLSRVPVSLDHSAGNPRGAASAWGWPIVGALLAMIAAVPGLLLASAGLNAQISAGASLATLIILTGAMHEDGLADTADGLWGGWDPARRLEIMKDSRIGVYGVLALVMATGLRWAALSALLTAGALSFLTAMIAAAALSRAIMAVLMHLLPPARSDGLSSHIGAVPAASAKAAAALGSGLSFVAGVSAGFVASLCAGLAGVAVARVARAKIGGQTGDILGASQQISEIAALIAVLAILT